MDRIRTASARTFSALANRNYRLWFIGQGISLSGTWMQTVAQGLLVLQLTGSGAALGLVIALQTLPVLLFGTFGGVIADRFPKRSILYITQTVSGVLALSLGILVATGAIRIWMVYVLAVCLGVVSTVDNPTRQAFLLEMVGKDNLINAVSLNSTEINLARVIGPTIAGVLIATIGIAACFIVNGVSYIAVLACLAAMRGADLHPTPLAPRAPGMLLEGLRYVRSSPVMRTTLLMMAVIGTFTYEFSVSLPLFAEVTFAQGPSTYAAMTAAMGAGAVVGGLYTAGRAPGNTSRLTGAAFWFGVAVLVTSIAPTLPLALVALLVVGFFSISFTAMGNSTLQLASAAEMRGRVMSLWTVAFLGSTPIGGPLIGTIGEHAGARWALALGGIAAIAAAAFGHLVLNPRKPAPEAETVG